MKDPKKPDRERDDRAAEHDHIRDLFKGIEDLDQSAADAEEEDVLELDEVVDDGEEGLNDLPELGDDLADLADLDGVEPGLEEPELDESLFDEEVTVELAPPGKALKRPREPLERTAEEEAALEEELGEAEEEKPLPGLEDVMEPEAASAEGLETETLDDLLSAEEAALEDLGEAEPELEPLETEVWDADKELESLLKTAEAGAEPQWEPEPEAEPESETEPETELEPEWEPQAGVKKETEPVWEEPVPEEPQRPSLEPAGFDAQALEPIREVPGAERAEPDSGDLAILGSGAVGAGAAARFLTSTESGEEAMMEERPAMFQPIVEVLEKRLQARVQAMVQKAVQEELPGIVRRVLQEEIERLSKSLG